MIIKPDTFLLIIISSGVCVITVGMIIALICPPQNVFVSLRDKLRKFFCKCWKRRKEENWRKTIIAFEGGKGYPISLVEGRPQGHGFYTAGPWSSTETTTTCAGNDILSQINRMSDHYGSSVSFQSLEKTNAETQTPTTNSAAVSSSPSVIFPHCTAKEVVRFSLEGNANNLIGSARNVDEGESLEVDTMTELQSCQAQFQDISGSGYADSNDMMACI